MEDGGFRVLLQVEGQISKEDRLQPLKVSRLIEQSVGRGGTKGDQVIHEELHGAERGMFYIIVR
jgi:hypothetical protein